MREMTMFRTHAKLLAGLVCLLVASSASAVELTTGNPKIGSIDSVGFGPDGLLMIGDGKNAQVVAVQTGDTKSIEWGKLEGGDIKEQIAGRLGTNAKGIDIIRMIVNPASHRAYIAVRKLEGKQDLIVTVDGQGKIQELPLDNVKFTRYALPADEKSPGLKITDITYADGRILLAAGAMQQFTSKIYSIDTRDEKAVPYWISTDTFHVAHGKWETNAPIRTVIPYKENGKSYLVGAFTCTPIVKYSLDDLQTGGRVKGQSVIELGNANEPLDMFVYEKDGKSYILMNHTRMAKFSKNQPIGNSQYWTAKVAHGILAESEKVNEKAALRIPPGSNAGENKSEQAFIVPEYAGVMMMDRLDADRALTIRADGKGGFALAIMPLP